jgi:hypothetical protein
MNVKHSGAFFTMIKVFFYFTFLQGLLIFSTPASTKTSNTLFSEDSENPFGRANSVLLGDVIVYQTINADEGSQLWAYNTTSYEKTHLFTGQLNQFEFAKYLHATEEHAYFSSGNDFSFQFWRTDGTPSGTVQLQSPSLFPAHSIADGILVSWSNQDTLIATDGTEVVEHSIKFPLTYNICAFDAHDIIATRDGTGLEDAILVRSNKGVLSVLSEGFPEFFGIGESNSFRLGNKCYLLIYGFSGEFNELLVVDKSGEVTKVSQSMDISNISRIFAFKNRIYAFGNDMQSGFSNTILRFNGDMSGFDAEFSLGSGFSFSFVNTSLDYIMAQSTTPTASPAINSLTFFTEDLQVVDNLGGLFVPTPTIYLTADGEWYGKSGYANNTASYTLSDAINFEGGESLVTSNFFLKQVITSPSSPEIFLKLTDKITGQGFFAQMADTPDINASTAGIWHDPIIQNQGLVINKGKRANGSDYLFVSVYTQDQGAPLWLAGNSDIHFPQKSIEIELFKFEGTDFFESETDTIRTRWGKVNLEMTSCDGLQATFDGVNESSRTINLVRIDNITYSGLCSD